MNKNLKLGLAITFFCCGGAAVASAQDDSVQVNLSVLENLSNTAAIAAPSVSEPLFPIVKKAPKVKKSAAKPARRSSAGAAKPAAVKESASAAAPKVTVEVRDPIPAVSAEPEVQPALQQIPFVKDAEPVVVVDVEPAAAPKAADTRPASAQVPQPAANVNTSPAVENQQPVAPVEMVPAESVAAKPAPALLVDEQAPKLPQPGVNAKISFADGVDELNDEQKKQIDAIIASFEDAANNKIAIYSYNLDDGVDVFKKKRLSLNRAVEIRSYLLPRGYKNFSIKVVNVDAASGKGNTVELEELK